jgi:predicted nucleic acid-binding protein
LFTIKKLDLILNWDQIIEFQFNCLKNGLNGIGIPDLIIAQNAKQNRCEIYSLDHHFRLMKDILELQLLD